MKKLMFLICICLPGLLIQSCKKDGSSGAGTAHLAVRMTDAPATYDAVNVDVQGVEITGSGSNTIMLDANAGIYNLLDFSNGFDTLIAFGDIEPQTVEQIRLILGPNNSIVVDGTTYPLSTPSAMQSGLKLNVHQTFEAGVTYAILLDFDANKSVVVDGSGDYKLKPVIRTIETAISGSIKGSISVPGVIATVTASANGNTYSSVTDLNGNFIIAGLPAGTYSITITIQ
jgi:hypothetical protein